MKNNVKWFLIGAISIVVLVFAIYAISNTKATFSNDFAMTESNNSGYKDYYASNDSQVGNATDANGILGEKVIYTANISLKTEDYDKDMQTVKNLIDNNNGGIANLSESSRNSSNGKYMYANIVIRVPQTNFNKLTQQIRDCGMHISAYSENTEDITQAYMDVESKIESLKQQEQVLNNLLTQAKNVSEIIEITNQKQQVIQQIEYNVKLQQKYDNRVDYSTVTISIQEVEATQVTDKGFGQRVVDTILSGIDGLKFVAVNFALVVVYLLPFILVIGVIITVVVLIRKGKNKKKQDK